MSVCTPSGWEATLPTANTVFYYNCFIEAKPLLCYPTTMIKFN